MFIQRHLYLVGLVYGLIMGWLLGFAVASRRYARRTRALAKSFEELAAKFKRLTVSSVSADAEELRGPPPCNQHNPSA
jgi:hypothetical protein